MISRNTSHRPVPSHAMSMTFMGLLLLTGAGYVQAQSPSQDGVDPTTQQSSSGEGTSSESQANQSAESEPAQAAPSAPLTPSSGSGGVGLKSRSGWALSASLGGGTQLFFSDSGLEEAASSHGLAYSLAGYFGRNTANLKLGVYGTHGRYPATSGRQQGFMVGAQFYNNVDRPTSAYTSFFWAPSRSRFHEAGDLDGSEPTRSGWGHGIGAAFGVEFNHTGSFRQAVEVQVTSPLYPVGTLTGWWAPDISLHIRGVLGV